MVMPDNQIVPDKYLYFRQYCLLLTIDRAQWRSVLPVFPSDSWYMMTSSNGSIFRVTGPLCREFTGHR